MNGYSMKITLGSSDIDVIIDMRKRIFHDEQGFTENKEATDDTAWHFLLSLDGRPAATARSFAVEGKQYIGRFAVEKDMRASGIGRRLMTEIFAFLAEKGVSEVFVSSQDQAVGFYEKLGFTAIGKWYMDEFCPHITMVRKL